MLVGNITKASNDSRSVLYAREAPVLSTPYQISDMLAGNVSRKVDKTQTMEDGTVMHAVGIIRRVYTGDGAPIGLYRVDPEASQFKTDGAEMIFTNLPPFAITNAKKEPIAYFTTTDLGATTRSSSRRASTRRWRSRSLRRRN